ncbi:DNA-directed RNA polymerases I and III subunit RPAC2-like [Lineus longissimus]|uniref:DNA-directed RNA polymerases I and III subunit RPAC2-like n=1 Tax=Lineus longissimus TaxID=88925 RepID=UPI002B4C776D
MVDEGKKKTKNLEVVETDDPEDDMCRTFVMNNEDHTLGNALRYMVIKNPDVKFCGYSVPHPSENRINFRIQTNGPPAVDVLRRGLAELTTVCEHVLSTFEDKCSQYKKQKEKREEELMDS